eukprot:PLAT1644.3.p1 GENE.PLAT1644.3~~PLAT1644.3.p1  ORF type:complete len:163 (+),score=30.87 PLAT1644.3:66-491(+)
MGGGKRDQRLPARQRMARTVSAGAVGLGALDAPHLAASSGVLGSSSSLSAAELGKALPREFDLRRKKKETDLSAYLIMRRVLYCLRRCHCLCRGLQLLPAWVAASVTSGCQRDSAWRAQCPLAPSAWARWMRLILLPPLAC